MDSFMITDIGNREVNEDSAGIFSANINGVTVSLYVLADGLGGHGKGEVASAIAVQSAKKVLSEAQTTEGLFEKIIEDAQANILKKQEEEQAKSSMKTTIVLLVVYGNVAKWAHVGDSRLYVFRKGKYIFRTLDHSVPQMLVLSGEIKEKSIRNHPDRNRLLRVLGDEAERLKYELSDQFEIFEGDVFILCSDGFWENITEKEMSKILKKNKSSEETLNLMLEVVKKRAKSMDLDNNTAVMVRV